MNLNEAIDLLKKNKYLVELTSLPKIYNDKYGSYTKMTKQGREKRNAKNTYKDDQRYNDHEGILWLDVKQKDRFTLSLAVLSGLIDSDKINCFLNYNSDDEDIDIYEDLNLDNIQGLDDLEDIYSVHNQLGEFVESVLDFLFHYMKQRHVRVYRGLEISCDFLINVYKKDKLIMQSPLRLVKYLDNTTKEFNSFSTNKNISYNFVSKSDSYIIFSGEIDNNDVNWAFSAYLIGRHGTTSEQELNLNNIKQLKNIKIDKFKIGDWTKGVTKLYLSNPNISYADQISSSGDLYIVKYKNSDDKYIINSTGKKIIKQPVNNFINDPYIRNYIKIELTNKKFCLISKYDKHILFPNGYDDIVSEKNGYIYAIKNNICNVFDEDGNLIYKNPLYFNLWKKINLPNGNSIQTVFVYPDAGVTYYHKLIYHYQKYNAITNSGKFIFDKHFNTADELETALKKKFSF